MLGDSSGEEKLGGISGSKVQRQTSATDAAAVAATAAVAVPSAAAAPLAAMGVGADSKCERSDISIP